jgi:hydrogenase expression/formation protein HypE
MRDPTRGGIVTTLNELAAQSGTGMILNEDAIPVKNEVHGVCELLGLEPLYLANEGKMVIICPGYTAPDVVNQLKRNKYAENTTIIGEVVAENAGKVLMRTVTGKRILDMQTIEQTPRIC